MDTAYFDNFDEDKNEPFYPSSEEAKGKKAVVIFDTNQLNTIE